MQNTTTEMRECVGCKTTMSFEIFEKTKKECCLKPARIVERIIRTRRTYYRECIVKLIENK